MHHDQHVREVERCVFYMKSSTRTPGVLVIYNVEISPKAAYNHPYVTNPVLGTLKHGDLTSRSPWPSTLQSFCFLCVAR
jgi:hypothetical protein